MTSSYRAYKDDSLLQSINRKYVSLRDEDILRNNQILHQVLRKVVETLKEKNDFYRAYLRDITFAGSFYKGTKVGKPEEFDCNVVIQLPLKYELIQFENDKPGFIKLKVNKKCYNPDWDYHKRFLAKLVTQEGYLDQDEFRRCMESALDDMPKTVTIFSSYGSTKFELTLHKGGPAFTLCVKQQNSLAMCVDLVPVLEFSRQPRISGNVGTEKPLNANTSTYLRKKPKPLGNSRETLSTSFDSLRLSTGQNGRNPSNCRQKPRQKPRKRRRQKKSWFAIPKSGRNLVRPNLYWRMSFYRREQILLKKYQHAKPVIRLLKKLRDTQNWKVLVSYHIETSVLHRIETMDRKPELRNNSLTEDFVHMLGELKTACETKKIINFWDRSHNLIADVEPIQLASIASRLETMLKQIEKNPDAIANFILTTLEHEEFSKSANQ